MNRPGWLRDPAASSLLMFAGMVIAGFVVIVVGYKYAAATLVVGRQMPALVSGGMGGLALILLGAGLANVQVGRRLAAIERTETEDLLDEASALVDALARKS